MKEIKPGTLCMIRGVPHGLPGSESNGNIVIAGSIKRTNSNGTRVYLIEPPIIIGSTRFTGCREQYLWPFEDPDTLGLTATNKTLENV